MTHTTVINYKEQRRAIFADEANDCTVRALANASGISYYDAHTAFAKAGRRQRRGTRYTVWAPVYNAYGFNKLTAYGDKGDIYKRGIESAVSGIEVETTSGMTLGKFIKNNQKGNFIVIVRGHALALKDGVVYDSHQTKPGTRVVCTLAEGTTPETKTTKFDKRAYMKAYNAKKKAAKAAQ